MECVEWTLSYDNRTVIEDACANLEGNSLTAPKVSNKKKKHTHTHTHTQKKKANKSKKKKKEWQNKTKQKNTMYCRRLRKKSNTKKENIINRGSKIVTGCQVRVERQEIRLSKQELSAGYPPHRRKRKTVKVKGE